MSPGASRFALPRKVVVLHLLVINEVLYQYVHRVLALDRVVAVKLLNCEVIWHRGPNLEIFGLFIMVI